jgi:short-subunit dehydrogenase
MSTSFYFNKTIMITGSSRGLGRVVAHQALQNGGNVILHGRGSEDGLDDFFKDQIAKGKAIYVCGAIEKMETAEQLVSAAVEHFGSLDVLINNAGISNKGAFLESDISVVNQVIQTNLMAVLQLTHLALPHIIQSKGSVLFISSLAAFVGLPGYLPYSASKMALRAVSESLDIELKRQGVHIGIIYFGFVENDDAKYTLNPSGHKEKVPPRNKLITFTKEEAGLCIEKVLRKRQKTKTPGITGKLFYGLSNYASFLFSKMLSRQYEKKNKPIR